MTATYDGSYHAAFALAESIAPFSYRSDIADALARAYVEGEKAAPAKQEVLIEVLTLRIMEAEAAVSLSKDGHLVRCLERIRDLRKELKL